MLSRPLFKPVCGRHSSQVPHPSSNLLVIYMLLRHGFSLKRASKVAQYGSRCQLRGALHAQQRADVRLHLPSHRRARRRKGQQGDQASRQGVLCSTVLGAVCSDHVQSQVKEATAWEWNVARKQGLLALHRLLSLDLPKLWPMSCPDEAFVKYVTQKQTERKKTHNAANSSF